MLWSVVSCSLAESMVHCIYPYCVVLCKSRLSAVYFTGTFSAARYNFQCFQHVLISNSFYFIVIREKTAPIAYWMWKVFLIAMKLQIQELVFDLIANNFTVLMYFYCSLYCFSIMLNL